MQKQEKTEDSESLIKVHCINGKKWQSIFRVFRFTDSCYLSIRTVRPYMQSFFSDVTVCKFLGSPS